MVSCVVGPTSDPELRIDFSTKWRYNRIIGTQQRTVDVHAKPTATHLTRAAPARYVQYTALLVTVIGTLGVWHPEALVQAVSAIAIGGGIFIAIWVWVYQRWLIPPFTIRLYDYERKAGLRLHAANVDTNTTDIVFQRPSFWIRLLVRATGVPFQDLGHIVFVPIPDEL